MIKAIRNLNRQFRFDISRPCAICKYLKLTCDQFVFKNIYFYQQLSRLINIFLANVSLPYTLKTQKNLLVSDVFREYKVKYLFVILFRWFSNNQMKVNTDKCHLIVSKNENTNCEKLLGIKVDSRLNFNEHLDGIIKEASRKINALSRITPFLNISKRRILMNSFFSSQFNYCPLVSMFIAVLLTTRLTVYTKEPCVLYIMTLNHPLKIF